MQLNTEEQRKFPRWIQEEKVISYVDGNRLDGLAENLSSGGAFIETTTLMEVGSRIAVVFQAQCSGDMCPKER